MQPDDARAEETRSWLSKAAKDLEAARHDFRAEPPLLEDIVFHSQQAVEKSLQALLTWHGRVFRKTHNLIELGEACSQIEASLEQLLRQAAPLTEYAWKFRYPGEPVEPTTDEAKDAVELAGRVFHSVAAFLPPEARV
jgi:HEPN domain-containing protein